LLSFHDELQDGIPDSDLISVIQDPHINEFAVDKGSIGAHAPGKPMNRRLLYRFGPSFQSASSLGPNDTFFPDGLRK
jgi:hypothetical protein